MDNEFHTPFGKLPLKETIDFAKNLGFVYTFQSLATVLTVPHNGLSPPWTNMISVCLITLAGGVLTAMIITLYMRNWDASPARTRLLALAMFALGGVLVQKLTEARLTEGW